MKKKALTVVLALVMLFSCSFAAQARASEYLTSYSVNLVEGDGRGEIDIVFHVQAAVYSTTRLGITRLQAFRSDGSLAAIITGSTSNGLISTDGGRYYRNSYTFTGTPGTSYYFIVTCYAGGRQRR